MKKLFVSFILIGINTLAFAQNEKEKDLMTWYHKDFATTKVYGINTDNAYKYLESKGLKPKKIIVGVLDSGVDVNHPGLIENIWKNPNEVPGNEKDDDGNGYIDDIHGWNFIGGKNADIEFDNLEITRILKKYQPIFEGPDSTENKKNQVKLKKEFEIFTKSKEIFDEKSTKAKQSYQFYKGIYDAIPSIISTLKGKKLTKENLQSIKPAIEEEIRNLQLLYSWISDPNMQEKTPEELEKLLKQDMEKDLKYFETQALKHYNLNFDPRAEIVGDNYEDYSEKYYGNNTYQGPDAQHGTHVAGIIAGYPQGKEIQYGIAHKVAKIMVVRTVPDGDERDKDVANAIRYAVDNGAKIINMSFGKPVSPGKEHVWDAFRYAEEKGVLLVKAAGNENQDVEKNHYYPTNFKNTADKKPFINNMIVVGASTKDSENLKASFSNYNRKMVNVFAPGNEIYSTVPNAKYEYLQGTSMASPIVAGAATVLLAYMPTLKPEQIIESLVKTVNTNSSISMSDQIHHSLYSLGETDVSPGRFNLLSESGGVIDIGKAAQYAYEKFYSKSIKEKSNSKSKKIRYRSKARSKSKA